MNNRVRYTRQNIITSSFYQLPKFLFDTELAGLTNDARVLYALLRNRHEISIKNEWYDENDEVYIYFKREDMQDMLHLSDKTITKAMNGLKEFCLLEEVRQGASKPNRIYLLSAMVQSLGIEVSETLENTMNRKIYDSRPGDFTIHDTENLRLHMNHNKEIHKDINKSVSESAPAPTQQQLYGEFHRVRLALVQYDALITAYGRDKTTEYIDRLDRHIESTGKRYESHYATIKKWIYQDEQKPHAGKPKLNKFTNYEQREWDFEQIEQFERQKLFEDEK